MDDSDAGVFAANATEEGAGVALFRKMEAGFDLRPLAGVAVVIEEVSILFSLD